MLTSSVNENDVSRAYFIKLGPEVVPIVTQKLNASLDEGASAEGARNSVIMDMPLADQKRIRIQMGLIAMQGVALKNMRLDNSIRRAAVASLYRALKSPYQLSRYTALYAAAHGVGSEAVNNIIPLLNDITDMNRATAAKMLAEVGDTSAAKKIEEILKQRRQSLTAEQVDNDGSFRSGYEAIKELRKKAETPPIQSPGLQETPKPWEKGVGPEWH